MTVITADRDGGHGWDDEGEILAFHWSWIELTRGFRRLPSDARGRAAFL